MFVALDEETKGRVTSLAPEWSERREELRGMAAAGRLVCPGCRQQVLFRSGEVRRPHFAHRHLTDCPLARQSAEVLEAKAQLYTWLETKFPGKVELDVDLQLPGWEPFADLVVRPDDERQFVYWVFDRQQRHREPLLTALADGTRRMHVIHTQAARQVAKNGRLLLSASQRDFTASSAYDGPHSRGTHLTFLDTERKELTIYRGLFCAHEPNVFGFQSVRTKPLAEALIGPQTGEIVFAEDVEARRRWLEEQARIERERKARQAEEARLEQVRIELARKAREAEEAVMAERARRAQQSAADRAKHQAQKYSERWQSFLAERTPRAAERVPRVVERAPHVAERAPRVAEPQPTYESPPLKCEVCGIITKDWGSGHPGKGTCVCSACLARRYAAKPT